MRYHWPPRPLGLGPPLNLVTLSREHRARLGRHAMKSVVFHRRNRCGRRFAASLAYAPLKSLRPLERG